MLLSIPLKTSMEKEETAAKHHTLQPISINYYSNVNALKRLIPSPTNLRHKHNFSPLSFS